MESSTYGTTETRFAFASLLVALLAHPVPEAIAQSAPPVPAPWTVAEEVVLPPEHSPPREFVALALDFDALAAALAEVPREQPGVLDPTVRIMMPLPGGAMSEVAVVATQMMEPALAAAFPEIRTYAFESLGRPRVVGHLAIGLGRARASAQTGDGIMRLDPVETAAGVVHLSYLDRHRTDGLNDLHVVPGGHGEHDERPPDPGGPPVPMALQGFAMNALQAGDQFRIYRLAATTTGEFYQARDSGAGVVSVVFSMIGDLIGANAVFEPEVSVRLILANATLDLLYDDPTTDPFDNGAQCSTSGNSCTANSDCDTANGESCDPNTTACTLRDQSRDNLKAVVDAVDPDQYDLGFLFAARPGGGANGCAWFVVCLTTNDTLHKGRGAGLMGNNGLNSASGLIAHEVGHMLGARHTFTGVAGSCTLNEFLAGDSESGYEPGSGTTRMSYRGNCADDPNDPNPLDDNVDTDRVPAGSYFHSRSFDEIVDNVFAGDGATCGSLSLTGNLPPVVDAGADYTIPRQTPFSLSGSAFDDEELTFNWEQYDRAESQRPIDTDLGDGPIIRSVPPGDDPSRTIPNLLDLLEGVQRKGEILPQVDRELNFRLIARDNRMAGGGVAYDTMVVNVVGAPFFITSPNSGVLQAGCPLPITWEVGGGAVAPDVSILYSTDGGLNFTATLAASTPNDGAFDSTVPCDLGGGARVKVQAVDNIFFDISDEDKFVFNNPPDVSVSTAGGAVDDNCEFLVEFTATATDACGLSAADVEVAFFQADDNFSLGTPTINILQVSPTEVSVSGNVVAFDLLSSPGVLAVSVSATDGCGEGASDFAEAVIIDDIPPEIDVALDPNSLWPPNHKMVPIEANVVATDNCPGVSFALAGVVSNEPDDGIGDGNTVDDIQGAEPGTPDLSISLRAERAGPGNGRVYTATYTATDGSGNETDGAATVTVPKHP